MATISLPGVRPSQPAAASSETAEAITTAMASAAPSRLVSALETIARVGGISASAGLGGSVFASAASGFSFLACAGSSTAPAPAPPSPKLKPSKGSLRLVLKAPIFTGPASPYSDGASAGGDSAGDASGGGGGTASAASACTGGGCFEGGFLGGGPEGSSLTSRSMSSKLGIGFDTPADFGGGGVLAGPRSASGASPVSSAMPKRSFASSRRAAPLGPLRTAAAGRDDAAGREAGEGGGRDAEPPGRPTGPVLGRATCAASSEDISMVLPGPGAGASGAAPGLRTWKTFLQEVQRTRTPRSVTLSSAMRNFD